MSLMTISSGRITDSAALPDPIPILNIPWCYEEYNNHNGTVDNYTQSNISGGGTATPTAATHSMNLDSGNTAADYANFMSKTPIILTAHPIIVNFLISGIANGTGASKNTFIGLRTTFASAIAYEVGFMQEAEGGSNSNAWSLRRQNDLGSYTDYITAPVNGDLLTIIATLGWAKYLINGIKIATLITGIPEADKSLYIGATVLCGTTAGTSRKINVDMMSIKKFI